MLPELTTRELHGCIVVEVRGESDVASVPELEQCLSEVLDRQAPVIVLDLHKTSFADVATLRAVLITERRALSQGGRLVLAAPQPAVARLLEVMGLGCHFSVFPTADEAALREGTAEGSRNEDACRLTGGTT